MVTLWNLWKGRNNFQFNGNHINNYQIAFKSKMMVRDIQSAFDSKKDQVNSNNIRLIKWIFPNAGTSKINTNRSLARKERGGF